uniref:Zona pellucida sperm-binding protein 3 n=1 Tax=Mastacembelus armatus TaxID=205130 RepID=A0A3Q3L9S7_9TELE
MANLVKYTESLSVFIFLLSVCACSADDSHVGFEESTGLELKCGEVEMSVTAKRRFFEDRHIPFRSEYLQLGADQQSSCKPRGPVSGAKMRVSAGLRECGTESRVHGEWLVYFNQLLLSSPVAPTSTGSVTDRGSTTVIPVECYYKRKQTVNGEPLTPTWLPMTSTISVFGLLHFSLRTMADGCSSLRSSSVYQRGEAVFLEARVEGPLEPPLILYVDYCVATLNPDPLSEPSYKFITKHGCHMDSVLSWSSSKFLSREQDNRLCFSVKAFWTPVTTMFISCHLRATLKQNANSYLNKACFFHQPTSSWRATEGHDALCECCDTDDCSHQSEEEKKGQTVGPIHTLPHSDWTGHPVHH